VGLRFSPAQTGPKRTLLAASGCVHHFLHCLVRCPPYVRIAKVARQQLGEAMEVLAAQVAWTWQANVFICSSCASLNASGISFRRGPWAVITEIDQCVCGNMFLHVRGAQDSML